MTKTAFITGGSRGIGEETAHLLREAGWDIVAPRRAVLDFADLQLVYTYIMDWLSGLQVHQFDAVIFCHGEWYARSPWQNRNVDPAIVWYRQMTMRVFTPMYLLQFLLGGDPRWRPKCVIMVSSTRGLIGGVNTGPYAAACAAQIALMQGYAREYPGVRFNAIACGLTDTDMGREVIATGGAKPDAIAQPPESVAREIVRLIESDDNGRVMRVVDSQVSEAKWHW